jgi:hypothetical protein
LRSKNVIVAHLLKPRCLPQIFPILSDRWFDRLNRGSDDYDAMSIERRDSQGGKAMASTLNDSRVISTTATVEQTEASDALRIARYCTLEEFLGLVFGVMQSVGLSMSLAKLAL